MPLFFPIFRTIFTFCYNRYIEKRELPSNNDSNPQIGWGSWIRKERNSDCSPQAQSRQQRMTESEEVKERENRVIFAPGKIVKKLLFLAGKQAKTY